MHLHPINLLYRYHCWITFYIQMFSLLNQVFKCFCLKKKCIINCFPKQKGNKQNEWKVIYHGCELQSL